jgi:hypothetical protein
MACVTLVCMLEKPMMIEVETHKLKLVE